MHVCRRGGIQVVSAASMLAGALPVASGVAGSDSGILRGAAGVVLLLALLGPLIGLSVSYWVIRLAVRHALRDARREASASAWAGSQV